MSCNDDSCNTVPAVPAVPVQVFFDFDDVINWAGSSRNNRKKYADAPGYPKRSSVWVDDENHKCWFNLDWSGELIRKLNTLKEATGFKWVWHTTWVGYTDRLDEHLGVTSDSTTQWNPYPTNWRTMPSGDLAAYRNEQKLDVVLNWAKANPTTPFVWVDDEATALWTDEVAATVTNPNLVLQPLPEYGLVLYELKKIDNFVKEHTK